MYKKFLLLWSQDLQQPDTLWKKGVRESSPAEMPACTVNVAPVSLPTRDKKTRHRKRALLSAWETSSYPKYLNSCKLLRGSSQLIELELNFHNAKTDIGIVLYEYRKQNLWYAAQHSFWRAGRGRSGTHVGEKCMSLPCYLLYWAGAKEAHTKQEAGNCIAPSGSESYSLLARWSHLVKNGVEESSTNNDARLEASVGF